MNIELEEKLRKYLNQDGLISCISLIEKEFSRYQDTDFYKIVTLPDFFSKSTHTNNNISVSAMPPSVKYSPFLNTEVAGLNIQKAETTKNSSAPPKKMLSQNSG